MLTTALSSPTHPVAIAEAAVAQPDRVAVRFRQSDGWVAWTRREYARAILRQARHLQALGLQPGERVGIVGPTSPGWAVGALAVQAAGGVIVGLYPTSAPAQLEQSFRAVSARIVLVGAVADEPAYASALDRVSGLTSVLAIDPIGTDRPPSGRWPVIGSGVSGGEVPGGGAADDRPEEALLELAKQLDPDAPCSIIFTSGTTGEPKAAVHSYRSIAQIADTVVPALDYRESDDYFVYLPLNHAAEQSNTLVVGGHLGWTLNFGRSMETIYEDLADVRPTVVFGVPRVFEKIGRDCLAAAGRGGDVADSLRTFGLDRLRVVLGGGAPMAPELIALFDQHGICIRNGYGSTEANGICMPWETTPRDDTVGTPLPGVEIRLAEDGEILIRSHGLCIGYLAPDGRLEPLADAEGFFHSGDIGQLTEDGQLRLIDRKRDIIITSGGKNISPSLIEQALVASPYLRSAVVVGNDRPYLVALLTVDLPALDEWARMHGLDPIDEDRPAARPEVHQLLAAEVAAVNDRLSRPEQIKRWTVVPAEPGSDAAVTASMKIRRAELHRRYREQIDALYEEVGQ